MITLLIGIVILCNNYMFLSLMILICRVVPVLAKRTYIHMYEYEQLQLGSCALN